MKNYSSNFPLSHRSLGYLPVRRRPHTHRRMHLYCIRVLFVQRSSFPFTCYQQPHQPPYSRSRALPRSTMQMSFQRSTPSTHWSTSTTPTAICKSAHGTYLDNPSILDEVAEVAEVPVPHLNHHQASPPEHHPHPKFPVSMATNCRSCY